MRGWNLHALVVLIGLLACSFYAPAQSTSKPKDKSGTQDNSAAPSGASAIWVSPVPGQCELKGKKLTFVLLKSAASASQPYYAVPVVPDNGLPVFFSGDELQIELIASTGQTAEIPLVNFGVDLQKADPINAAPVRPSFSQPSAAGVTLTHTFCLAWPRKLTPDTIPKITITAVYAPGGTAEADKQKTITLVTASFPQVHNLYRYNLAFGIVGSTLHNPSFSRVQTTLASGGTAAQFKTVKDNGDPYVAPALFFTAYVFRIDAEGPWSKADLRPQPSIGFSLSSPTDNFFFGASSEILRNVQLVYGYHLGRVNQLAPSFVDDPTSSAAPATQKRFHGGFFGGMTFNIDFIKGLVSGK